MPDQDESKADDPRRVPVVLTVAVKVPPDDIERRSVIDGTFIDVIQKGGWKVDTIDAHPEWIGHRIRKEIP